LCRSPRPAVDVRRENAEIGSLSDVTIGIIVRGGRRRTLTIGATWPWAEAITTAWQRVQAIPQAL
jgi:hypothetical protein